MATIYPFVVNNSEELDKAVSENKAVILVTNKDLIPAIKREVKEDTHKEEKHIRAVKATKKGAKIAAVGAAASIVTAVAAPVLALPAIVATAVGVAVTGGGAVTSIATVDTTKNPFTALTSKMMKCYVWNEVSEERFLLLVKISGRNTFDSKTDIISFDQLNGDSAKDGV